MKGGLHESYAAREEPQGGTDRNFGFVVGGILAAIAGVRWVFADAGLGTLGVVLLAIAVPLIGLAAIAPGLLAPLNKAWTKLGLLLFKIVNPIIMFLLYAVTIVPTGLIMKLVGYDPMRREKDPEASSYWIPRDPPGPEPETMRNPF